MSANWLLQVNPQFLKSLFLSFILSRTRNWTLFTVRGTLASLVFNLILRMITIESLWLRLIKNVYILFSWRCSTFMCISLHKLWTIERLRCSSKMSPMFMVSLWGSMLEIVRYFLKHDRIILGFFIANIYTESVLIYVFICANILG